MFLIYREYFTSPILYCQLIVHYMRRYLTLDNVLRQLKYRYDREINHCERSALKRIVERDDSSSKAMVLCIASVKPVRIHVL